MNHKLYVVFFIEITFNDHKNDSHVFLFLDFLLRYSILDPFLDKMSFNSTKDLCSLSEKIQNNGPIIVSMNVTTQCILHPIEIATQPGSYRSKTLGLHNKYRWHLLPKFPSTDNFDQPSNYLLLSNVPCM